MEEVQEYTTPTLKSEVNEPISEVRQLVVMSSRSVRHMSKVLLANIRQCCGQFVSLHFPLLATPHAHSPQLDSRCWSCCHQKLQAELQWSKHHGSGKHLKKYYKDGYQYKHDNTFGYHKSNEPYEYRSDPYPGHHQVNTCVACYQTGWLSAFKASAVFCTRLVP